MDIDLELDGLSTTQTALERLRERWDGPVEILVFSRAEYSEPIEFGRGPIESNGEEPLTFKVDGEWVSKHRVSGHPPYPFFRPALREFEAGPERFLRSTIGRDLDSFRNLRDLMDGIGSALERRMKANATAQQGGGRSPGTHPEHPQVQSGTLRRGIGYIMLGA